MKKRTVCLLFRPDRMGFMLIVTQSLQFPFPSFGCPIRQDLSWNITISLHFAPFTNKSATTRNSCKFHSCETYKSSRLCWETIATKTKSLLQINFIRSVSSTFRVGNTPLPNLSSNPMNQELLLTLCLLAILASC